jgi:hypothetical protein
MGTGVSDAQYFEVTPNVLCVKTAGIRWILRIKAGNNQKYCDRWVLKILKLQNPVEIKLKFLSSWDFRRFFANSQTRS